MKIIIEDSTINSNFGYHVGTLKGKSETLQSKGFKIGETGFLGTGYYFFGDKKDAIEYYNKNQEENIKIWRIKLNKYNLFRPKNPEEFYEGLKIISKNIYYTDYNILKNIKFKNTLDVLYDFILNQGLNISIKDFYIAILTYKEKISKKENGKQLSNYILEKLKYEGIDMTNTSLDNFAVGSVIFNLKENTLTEIKSTLNESSEKKQEYTWGAGILPICRKTGKILVQKRGKNIVYPNQWCTFGGKGEEGETKEQAAKREFKEESGYSGSIQKLKLLDTHSRKTFKFYNYLCIVPDEFKVTTINKKTDANHIEVQDAKWVDINDVRWGLKGEIHFGLKRLMHMRKKDIERYINQNCKNK